MQAFVIPKEFWENHLKIGNCWEWLGRYSFPNRSPRGYGIIWYKPLRKQIGVHRLAWILHNQQFIPKGMVIMHRCDNTRCYNPDHLVIGSQKDNVDDMVNKKRHGRKKNLVTHCVRGHEYTENNTIYYRRKTGYIQRKCRECKKIESRLYRLKHKHNMLESLH